MVTNVSKWPPLDMTNAVQVSKGKGPAVESAAVYVRTLTRGGEPLPCSMYVVLLN